MKVNNNMAASVAARLKAGLLQVYHKKSVSCQNFPTGTLTGRYSSAFRRTAMLIPYGRTAAQVQRTVAGIIKTYQGRTGLQFMKGICIFGPADSGFLRLHGKGSRWWRDAEAIKGNVMRGAGR